MCVLLFTLFKRYKDGSPPMACCWRRVSWLSVRYYFSIYNNYVRNWDEDTGELHSITDTLFTCPREQVLLLLHFWQVTARELYEGLFLVFVYKQNSLIVASRLQINCSSPRVTFSPTACDIALCQETGLTWIMVKTAIFVLTAVRTSNPTWELWYFLLWFNPFIFSVSVCPNWKTRTRTWQLQLIDSVLSILDPFRYCLNSICWQ
jgi:hypothetical protein